MSEIDVRRQAVSERRQALREIAREKAGVQDTVSLKPSVEDQQGTEEGVPFEQISSERLILEGKRDVGDSFSWTEFAPWGREKKKKHRPLNTATIWLMARKEIAREWREARGVKKRNPQIDILEREAAMWGEKQEEKRTRQEQARAEFEQQKVKVDEVLKIMGQKLLEGKDNLTGEKAMGLIEDAFGAAGKVYDVEWREDGCDICFEPWEERWPRQRRGEAPVIHRIRVNDKLEMVSYDLVGDDETGQKAKKEVMLTNVLKEPVDEEPLAVDEDEEDIKIRIERKIEKVGRLIELKKLKESTWLATVELWEAMKIRNVERKGEGPIETESILAKVVDGAIVITPIKGKKPSEKKEESKTELGTAQQ